VWRWRARATTLTAVSYLGAHATQDGDGVISRLEFVTRILVRLRRCTEEDIREIMRVFDSLDKDGSGSLSHDDIDYDDLRKRLKHLPSSAAVAQSTH
jgi:Ca2+-binding EF-hand superfamily protein